MRFLSDREGAFLAGAHLAGALLDRAHLAGAIGRTIEQLAAANTLRGVYLDPPLREQLERERPELFDRL